MSLLGTLATVAVGAAVARGARALANRGTRAYSQPIQAPASAGGPVRGTKGMEGNRRYRPPLPELAGPPWRPQNTTTFAPVFI
ncbi:MAG TPA: hypothetical protein EYP31_10950 [Roseibacterium sp.]|nr:hypothetical protein [Roseibacterium sp.]